nr:hypothetical protein [Tanacetum cinerariifolium]
FLRHEFVSIGKAHAEDQSVHNLPSLITRGRRIMMLGFIFFFADVRRRNMKRSAVINVREVTERPFSAPNVMKHCTLSSQKKKLWTYAPFAVETTIAICAYNQL